MAMRQGVGKVRHLAVRYLWVQAYVKKGLLTVKKERGEDNPADIGAKHVPKGDDGQTHVGDGAGGPSWAREAWTAVDGGRRGYEQELRAADRSLDGYDDDPLEGRGSGDHAELLHFWVMVVGIIMLMGVAFIMGMKCATRVTADRRDAHTSSEILMARRSGVDGRYKYHADEKCYGLRRSQLVNIDMCQCCKRKKV